MPTRTLLSLAALFVCSAVSPSHAADSRPATNPATATAPAVAKAPPRGDVLILPLHVHILSAKDRPDLDCKLTDDDLSRIVGKVNKVWRQAGVQFLVQPIHREDAVNVAEFDKQKEKVAAGALGHYRTLAPPASRELPGLHVYYVHELPPNGVYLGANIAFVKETASLRKVEGGIDEPIPRVTSHELGHALGLPHRQDRTNLMASGTTGTTFSEAELKIARAKAKLQPGALTIEAAEQQLADVHKRGEKADAGLAKVLEGLKE
jgi:hypothetical protein